MKKSAAPGRIYRDAPRPSAMLQSPMAAPDESPVNDLNTFVPVVLNPLDWAALILVMAGAVDWGLLAAFGWDPVQALLAGQPGALRAVRGLTGLAGLYCIGLVVRLGRRRRR